MGTRREQLRKKRRRKAITRLSIISFLIIIFSFIAINRINSLNIEATNAQDIKDNTGKTTGEKITDDNESDIVEKYFLEGTTYIDEDKKEIIKNVDDIIVLVNKNRNLPSDYIPEDLVVPNVKFPFKEDLPKKKMRKDAAIALEELFQAAKIDGIELYAISGYRSYNRQQAIFQNKANKVGEEEANKLVAYPGQSEHQTGLAMDVTGKSVQYRLSSSFGETAEGKWLSENSYKYGFIIRYPNGKEDITGYNYEPWHLRYVGKEAGEVIYKNDITLEELFK